VATAGTSFSSRWKIAWFMANDSDSVRKVTTDDLLLNVELAGDEPYGRTARISPGASRATTAEWARRGFHQEGLVALDGLERVAGQMVGAKVVARFLLPCPLRSSRGRRRSRQAPTLARQWRQQRPGRWPATRPKCARPRAQRPVTARREPCCVMDVW